MGQQGHCRDSFLQVVCSAARAWNIDSCAAIITTPSCHCSHCSHCSHCCIQCIVGYSHISLWHDCLSWCAHVCVLQMLPDQLGFAIVDEVDCILIDESRNPMIISQPRGDNGQLVITVDKVRQTGPKGSSL